MAKRKPPPPSWQKGKTTIEVTIPETKTESGEPETVPLTVRWEVRATKALSTRGVTKREMRYARDCIGNVRRYAANPLGGWSILWMDELENALSHAIRAWCRTHLRGGGANNQVFRYAFSDKAPEELLKVFLRASGTLGRGYGEYGTYKERYPSAEAIDHVTEAVEAMIAAAMKPPRNRRRFPARYRVRPLPRG